VGTPEPIRRQQRCLGMNKHLLTLQRPDEMRSSAASFGIMGGGYRLVHEHPVLFFFRRHGSDAVQLDCIFECVIR
jgi:hypothetical protein